MNNSLSRNTTPVSAGSNDTVADFCAAHRIDARNLWVDIQRMKTYLRHRGESERTIIPATHRKMAEVYHSTEAQAKELYEKLHQEFSDENTVSA